MSRDTRELCPELRHFHPLQPETPDQRRCAANDPSHQEAFPHFRARCVPDRPLVVPFRLAVVNTSHGRSDRLVPVPGGVLVDQCGAWA